MANSKEDILKIISLYMEKPINERGDIIQTINALELKTKNSYLNTVYEKEFKMLGLEKFRKVEDA